MFTFFWLSFLGFSIYLPLCFLRNNKFYLVLMYISLHDVLVLEYFDALLSTGAYEN